MALTFYNWLYFASFVSTLSLPALGQKAASDAYTPVQVTCPAGGSFLRSAGQNKQTLGPQESAYINARKSSVLPGAWSSYLKSLEEYAAANHVTVPASVQSLLGASQVPDGMTVGMAISGGGYRAAIVGGGLMNAFDSRNDSAISAGTGGLLQGLSYMTGLSGGGWLVSALTQADFPTFPDLAFGKQSDDASGETNTYGGFLSQNGFIDASSNDLRQAQYLVNIIQEINGKKAAFNVTMTDVWARVLSRHFVPGTSDANFFNYQVKHGAGLLWSATPKLPSFSGHRLPFPILVADSVSANGNHSNDMPDGFGVPLTNTMYEFNPYEFGSYDPMLSSFIAMQYLGSSGDKCYNGVDQTSYVQAVSSNVFNGISTDVFDKLIDALKATNPSAGTGILSAQIPNPFKGLPLSSYLDVDSPILSLADGGTDGQQIPFQPLLVKARGVDVIIGVDMATDGANGFPGGGSLIDPYIRATKFPESYSFPAVPQSKAAYSSQNLTTRPTFFGCDDAGDAPLVIYFANTAPLDQAPVTNPSTWQFTYQPQDIHAMIDQSFDIATQGIPTNGRQKDPQWPVCLACAVTDRARAKAGSPRDDACQACMTRYCWSPSA